MLDQVMQLPGHLYGPAYSDGHRDGVKVAPSQLPRWSVYGGMLRDTFAEIRAGLETSKKALLRADGLCR